MLALAVTGLASCNDDPVQPPVPMPEGGYESIGSGAWDKPLSVYQLRLGFETADDAAVWATGYIVGWVENSASPTFSMEEASVRFTAPAESSSNLVIAMTPEERDWTKCSIIKLTDSPVRSDINLKDHPELLGSQITVEGTPQKYCGVYGMVNPMRYEWGDKGNSTLIEPIPPMPAIQENVTFRKVDDIDSDVAAQYCLVCDGKYLAGLNTDGKSFGYLPCTQVTPENDEIVTSTINSYMFYPKKDEEGTLTGYEVRDSSGNFLWWDSDPTHRSFQLTSYRGSEGMIWTVTPGAAGTVEIKNVQFGVIWQYVSNYNNIGAYDNVSGSLPVLYKRVN